MKHPVKHRVVYVKENGWIPQWSEGTFITSNPWTGLYTVEFDCGLVGYKIKPEDVILLEEIEE